MSCCRNLIGNLPGAGGNGGGNGVSPTDPWEALAGDEVFYDNFTGFSGWTVYSGTDTTTTPTIDTTAGVFRAKSANPVVDVATRSRGLMIMPAHTANNAISLSQDISGSLTASGDWTMVSKLVMPNPRIVVNNSINASMAFCLPASNNARYNSVIISGREQDVGVGGPNILRLDNGVSGGELSFDMADAPSYPSNIWLMQYHQSGSSDVYGLFSTDEGRNFNEIGIVTKNPSTFTHLVFVFVSNNQMALELIFELCYVRVYQSIKTR